jgi:hypothetical protein
MGIFDRFLKRKGPSYADMSPQQVGAAVGAYLSEAKNVVALAVADARGAERRVRQAKDEPQASRQRLALAVADWRLRTVKAEICRAIWLELAEQGEHLKLLARADRETASQHGQRPTLFEVTPADLFEQAQRSVLSAIASGTFTAIERDLRELGIAAERIETLRELVLPAIPQEAGSGPTSSKAEDVLQEVAVPVEMNAELPVTQPSALSETPAPPVPTREPLRNTPGKREDLMGFVKRIWRDPVWSKVIAAGLITLFATSWGLVHFRSRAPTRTDNSDNAHPDIDSGLADLAIHPGANAGYVSVSHLDGVIVTAAPTSGGVINNNLTINNQLPTPAVAIKAPTMGHTSLLRQAQSHWYEFVTEIRPELAYYRRTYHRSPDPDAARETAELDQHYQTAKGILYKLTREEREIRLMQLGRDILSSFGGLIHRDGDQSERLESTEAGLDSLEKRLDERSRLNLLPPRLLRATGARPSARSAPPP